MSEPVLVEIIAMATVGTPPITVELIADVKGSVKRRVCTGLYPGQTCVMSFQLVPPPQGVEVNAVAVFRNRWGKYISKKSTLVLPPPIGRPRQRIRIPQPPWPPVPRRWPPLPPPTYPHIPPVPRTPPWLPPVPPGSHIVPVAKPKPSPPKIRIPQPAPTPPKPSPPPVPKIQPPTLPTFPPAEPQPTKPPRFPGVRELWF